MTSGILSSALGCDLDLSVRLESRFRYIGVASGLKCSYENDRKLIDKACHLNLVSNSIKTTVTLLLM